MTRPGVVVTSRADVPPRSAPTSASASFMVGLTADGADVERATSLSQYEAKLGDRAGFTDTYDAAEAFFREGGSALTVARTNPGVHPATRTRSSSSADDAPAPQVVDPTLTAALDLLSVDLGPGQLFVPGTLGESPDTHSALLAHAAERNRVALLHAAPDADAAALTALATTLRADVNARYGALFAPGAVCPGVTSAATRDVPYEALAAGIMARNDRVNGVNDPAAGPHGLSAFALDISAQFTDAEREDLNDAGVDLARNVYGQVQTYGYRALADPESGWGLLSNVRLNMEIVARCNAVAESYVFAQLDGRRVKIGQFGGDLVSVLVPYYESGQLFGETARDAFFVDIGPNVNPIEQLAQGVLRAVVGVRMSPFAELVVIEIVKVAVDQPLSLVA